MGFLALAALGAGLAPLLFPLPSAVETVLDVLEWVIVALFALEYAVHWSLAADKRHSSRTRGVFSTPRSSSSPSRP